MAKGDQIGIGIRGIDSPFITTARQNGRTVTYEFLKEGTINWIVVKELTRGGTVVNETRAPADLVSVLSVAIKEK
jgi:hypothetical protein